MSTGYELRVAPNGEFFEATELNKPHDTPTSRQTAAQDVCTSKVYKHSSLTSRQQYCKPYMTRPLLRSQRSLHYRSHH